MAQRQVPQRLNYLRNSERQAYRRCRQRWYWSYVDNQSPKMVAAKLRFGTLIHKALAGYYIPGAKRGPHPADVFREIYKEEGHVFAQWDDEGMKLPAYELGVVMLDEYVKKYGKDSDLVIVQPEMGFAIDVYDKAGNYLCTMVGRFDAIYRHKKTKRTGILEHKTCKSIPGPMRINSGYGEQGLTYWWAAHMYLRHLGKLAEDAILEEILYNFLRKGIPDERKRDSNGYALNMDGTISKRQPAPLFSRDPLPLGHNELHNINRRIRGEAWEIQQARAGKLPIYKSPTMDCDWDCQFRDLCEIHEMGGDWKSVFEMEFTTVDPYSDYELEFELA